MLVYLFSKYILALNILVSNVILFIMHLIDKLKLLARKNNNELITANCQPVVKVINPKRQFQFISINVK